MIDQDEENGGLTEHNIFDELKQRRWGGLGHVLRVDRNSHPDAALKWTPPEKRRRGRRLGTRRRTIEEDMKMAGKTKIERGWFTQDRAGWRRFVGILCPSGNDEE